TTPIARKKTASAKGAIHAMLGDTWIRIRPNTSFWTRGIAPSTKPATIPSQSARERMGRHTEGEDGVSDVMGSAWSLGTARMHCTLSARVHNGVGSFGWGRPSRIRSASVAWDVEADQ